MLTGADGEARRALQAASERHATLEAMSQTPLVRQFRDTEDPTWCLHPLGGSQSASTDVRRGARCVQTRRCDHRGQVGVYPIPHKGHTGFALPTPES